MTKARLASKLFLIAIVLLIAARWVHLPADPPWRLAALVGRDKSTDLYSDEGFDSSGAIASIRYGHWYLPHQFNLGVEAPVWSTVLGGVFRLTGINLVAARGLEICFFAASLWLLYMLIVELDAEKAPLALGAALILSSNFLAFCFSRMSMLESVWTFFFVATLLLAARACRLQSYSLAIGAGLCMGLAVTTKLTALSVLLPLCAIYYLFRAKEKYWVIPAWTAAGFASILAPYTFMVFSQFRQDHDYYHQINIANRAVHGVSGLIHSLWLILSATRFLDIPLCLAFLLGAFFFFRSMGALRTQPLFIVLFCWLIGDFLIAVPVAYYPPRYLLNPLFPLAALSIYFAETLYQRSRVLGKILFALLGIAVLLGIGEMGAYLLRPQYSLRAAAERIRQFTPETSSPRLMGDFAYTLAFYAPIDPYNDRLGVAPRPLRIQEENPQLYVTLDPAPPDSHADFAAAGRNLSQVAVLDALHNYFAGKRLYLYRVVPSQ